MSVSHSLSRRTFLAGAGGTGIAAAAPWSQPGPAFGAPAGVSDMRVVPALRHWKPRKGATGFKLGRRLVVVGKSHQLKGIADTFAEDLKDLTGHPVRVARSGHPRRGDIVMRLEPDASDHPEGYQLDVRPTLTISAPKPHGVFNATRSVLQLFQRADRLPAGTAKDWPTKPVRSVLMDNTPRHFSRKWWQSFFRQMAWFKLNDTNLYIDGCGLTKDEMRQIDRLAQRYYVRLVPQLNMPGHMAQVLPSHPEYQLQNSDGSNNPVALDLTNEKAVSWALGLVDEYAAIFDGDTWHLGSDEYPGWPGTGEDHPQLAKYAQQKFGDQATFWDLFADFQNRADTVVKKHGKTMRVWNDMVRDSTVVRLNEDVAVEYWITDPALKGLLSPQQLADRGHKLINADAGLLYYDMSRRNLDPRDLYEKFQVNTLTAGQRADPDHVAGARIAVWLAWIGTPMESDAEVLNNLRWDMAALSQHTWGDGTAMSWTKFRLLVDELGTPPGFIGSGNSITGRPALAANPDKSVAWFARDTFDHLWAGRQHDPASGPWSQVRLAPGIVGDPSTVVDDGGRVHVLARTHSGQVLHARQQTAGSDRYHIQREGHRITADPVGFVTGEGVGWTARSHNNLVATVDGRRLPRIARHVTTDPGVTVRDGTVHILAGTRSGSVHVRCTDGGWKDRSDEQRLASDPVLAGTNDAVVAVARSKTGALIAAELGDSVNWQTIRAKVAGQPSAIADRKSVHVAVRDPENQVLYAHRTGDGWFARVAWYDFIADPAIGLEKDDLPTVMGQNDRGFLAVVQPDPDDSDADWKWAHLAESTTGTPAITQDAKNRSIYAVTTSYGDLQTGTKWGSIAEWGRDFIVGTINYPGDKLAPDVLRRRLVVDEFDHDTTASYTLLRPTDEQAPKPAIRSGHLQVQGTDFFTLLRSGTGIPRRVDATVTTTIDAFADKEKTETDHARQTGEESEPKAGKKTNKTATDRAGRKAGKKADKKADERQDTVQLGYVRDRHTRAMTWYNHATQRLGFDTVVDATLSPASGDVPLQLVPGDELAVTLAGRWMTAYRHHNGHWDRIHSSPVNGEQDLADVAVRRHYRAGFALRASSGTLALDDFAVRGRNS